MYHSPPVEDNRNNNPVQLNQDIIEIKKYNFSPHNYTQELIETWIADLPNEHIDTIDDAVKINNFEIALSTALTDNDVNDVVIFGHNNSIYETLILSNNIVSNKQIIYISFDSINNNNMYNLYNNTFIFYYKSKKTRKIGV